MDLGLQGSVVLVTGASRGLGAAMAIALAREGATVVDQSKSPVVSDSGRLLMLYRLFTGTSCVRQ